MFDLAAPIAFLVATVGAIVSAALSVRHAFGMLTSTKSSAEPVNQLLPSIAFALPGTLDAKGRKHRANFVAWLLITAAFVIVAVSVRYVFGP